MASKLYFLSQQARASLKREHLPLAMAKWLVPAPDRKPHECIQTLPEYDPASRKQAVLSWLNAKNRPMPRLLFESRERACEFLAALPPEERTFYMHIPKDAPVAFYLDIDKPSDGRWRGHPNYSWEETLDALKEFVSFTYHRLTGGQSEPDWFEEDSLMVFAADGKPGCKKLMSKHVHTTKDPTNENRFWFSRRDRLQYFLKCMRRDVTEAYWGNPKGDYYKAARILAYTPHKERFFEQKVKRRDGSESVEQAERKLEVVFDIQGASEQWRLPLCRKSGGVPLEPEGEDILWDMEDTAVIALGDPVLPLDVVEQLSEKDFADAAFPLEKSESIRGNNKSKATGAASFSNFEEPSVAKQLKELLEEQKASTATIIKRRSEFKYYLYVDRGSKQERPCLVCKRTHGSCPGWIKVANDFSHVRYGCFRDDGKVEFDLPGGEQRVKDEEMLRQLRASNNLKEVLRKLDWYTDDLPSKILDSKFVSKSKSIRFDIRIPVGKECPMCKKHHKKLKLEITRKMVQATLVCNRDGRKADKRGRLDDVKEELSAQERFQDKRRKLAAATASSSSSGGDVALNALEQEFELQEDPDSPYVKPLVRNSFDKDDPLTWRDFENLLKSREPYDTFQNLKEYTLRWINRGLRGWESTCTFTRRTLRMVSF